MVRSLALALVLASFFALSGCGGEGDSGLFGADGVPSSGFGVLDDGDPLTQGDTYFDDKYFTLYRGYRLEFEVSSDDFDAMLAIVELYGDGEEEVIDSDDDSGEGSDAYLVRNLPAGDYALRVTSFDEFDEGEYRWRIRFADDDAGPVVGEVSDKPARDLTTFARRVE